MLPDELTMWLNWIKFKSEKPSMRDCPVVDEIKLKHLRPVLPFTQVREEILLSPHIINLLLRKVYSKNSIALRWFKYNCRSLLGVM